MKKILLVVLLATFALNLNAQKKNRKEDYRKAVFVKNDGSEMNVLYVDYTYPTTEWRTYLQGSDIINFEYKNTPDGKTEKINSKELKKVRFLDEYDDEMLGLEKLKMKAVDENGKVSDKSYFSWQPLLYDGKIKIYGSNSYACEGNIKSRCMYAISTFFLRNDKDDFAIMPIDYDRLNLLNFWKADERMIESFKLVGKNCSDFNKYVDIVYQKFQQKDFRKKMTADLKEARKKGFEEGKAANLSYNAIQKQIGYRVQEYYLNFYRGIISEYEKNCPH